MQDTIWINKQADSSLQRILPLLAERYANKVEEGEWQGYIQSLKKYFPHLFGLLHQLYGSQYDFFFHLLEILNTTTKAWIERPAEL